MAIPDPSERKPALRKLMRQIIRSHPAPDTAPICNALDRWLHNHPALRTIAVFSALPGEVDLLAFTAAHPDRHWAYPRVSGHDLIFHTVTCPASELTAGSFGILESSSAGSAISPEAIDAFLCPGLAFDPGGGRLGRGRGYYDRLLEKARADALKVGVCFPFQMVPNTFPEPHDIRMDLVISG